jgi:hypothetical protein
MVAGCSNTTGQQNNFLGAYAGIANTAGSYNNFFGVKKQDVVIPLEIIIPL